MLSQSIATTAASSASVVLLVLPVTQGFAFIHNLTIFQPFPSHSAASESIYQGLSPIWSELINTEHRCCTKPGVMERSLTHFEIYVEEGSKIAEFYRRIFVSRVERIPRVDYWHIFLHANENGPLRGGVTYRPISGLILYVSVASIDETMTLVQELGGSIVRTTGSRSI